MARILRTTLLFLALLLSAIAYADPPVDVLILTGPGGHRSASDHIADLLKKAGVSYAEVDYAQFSDWTFDQTVELSEKDPQASTKFYEDYYKKAAQVKSISELPQADWHYANRFMSVLNVMKPKVIITAYAISSELQKKLEEEGKVRNIVMAEVPTDYNTAPYWTKSLPTAHDVVFAPSEDWARKSIAAGTPKNKLIVTGIPANKSINRVLDPKQVDALWTKLGFNRNVMTVYVGGGSGGIGEFGKIVDSIGKQFAGSGKKVQVVFAVGNSAKKAAQVNEAARRLPENVKVATLGFDPNIADYMNYVADVVVSKGGGLTTTEVALSKGIKNGKMRSGRPFVILTPAFGVEGGNVEYFTEKGMARTSTVEDIGQEIRHLMDHPDVGEAMMQAQTRTIGAVNRPEKIVGWVRKQLAEFKRTGKKPYVESSSPMWVYEKLRIQKSKGERPFIDFGNTTTDQALAEYDKTKFQLPSKPEIKMAITVDDLPAGVGDFTLLNRHDAFTAMINVFKKHGIQEVYGFVNGRPIGEFYFGEKMLKDWLAAGYKLGNHTDDHLSATASKTADYTANIAKTDERLANLGVDAAQRRYFRFPFLQEGDTPKKRKAIQSYLDKNGYKAIPVTVDPMDYNTGAKYSKALESNADTDAVLAKGVEAATKSLKTSQALAKDLFGRDINHVLLLHLASVHVELLDHMLTQYENMGVKFVSVDEAMSDPAYQVQHHRAAETMGNFLEELTEEKNEKGIEGPIKCLIGSVRSNYLR